MYLKRIEIVGFKSFAEKTRLEFTPGMTSIVGPNGCGKSNISDAIRWVLGERRPTAIRGTTMEDCIFNGTESHRVLSMAEVSLTLWGCAEALDTEYDEVCITRRVFRSGESNYLLNKQPCRLKDIQRLFMDTGIGTDSYSIMEQGKIDQILSSRPEDRRAIFEEASGITKYKADKKTAFRKLEYTEANLARLSDVVREVKRQINSLKRQAGKARRYKKMRSEMRALDLYLTRQKTAAMTSTLEQETKKLEKQKESLSRLHAEIEGSENEIEKLRSEFSGLEEIISDAMDASLRAKSDLDRMKQAIETNKSRMAELGDLVERNQRESSRAHQQAQEQNPKLEDLTREIEISRRAEKEAQERMKGAVAQRNERDEKVSQMRTELKSLRNELVDLDSGSTRLQNEIVEIDAAERSSEMQKERLAAEKKGLKRTLLAFRKRRDKMESGLDELRSAVEKEDKKAEQLASDQKKNARVAERGREDLNALQQKLAGLVAQKEMLDSRESRQDDFPPGTRAVCDRKGDFEQEQQVIGPLARQIKAKSGYRLALEAVLRPWTDSLVVKEGAAARRIIGLLSKGKHGSARLLVVDGIQPDSIPLPKELAAELLIEKVTCDEAVRPLVERLLSNVYVVATLAEIPDDIPSGVVFAARDGSFFSGHGSAELWMPESDQASPLVRQHKIENLGGDIGKVELDIGGHQKRLQTISAERNSLANKLENQRELLNARKHEMSLQEGEYQVLKREIKESQERLDTVAWELSSIEDSESGSSNRRQDAAQELSRMNGRRADLQKKLSAGTEKLNLGEQERLESIAKTSELQIDYSRKHQKTENLLAQHARTDERIEELTLLVENRTREAEQYGDKIEKLQDSNTQARSRIEALEEEVLKKEAALKTHRNERREKSQVILRKSDLLSELRSKLEDKQEAKSELDLVLAQKSMEIENIFERVSSAYNVTKEELVEAPEPEWDGKEPPPEEDLETRVAELHAKLDSMGPVNLVAIEEHEELEERFAFLNQQCEDLENAKADLMNLIKRINKKTVGMFSETFEQINANFQKICKQLFGGGSAKLVLIDEEDVLESGIEIIARPPGKKLQNISLLSGGERTLTAVALLFSLYLVKPSPFCVLDEIDAALDEANIGRFIKIIQVFLKKSQFILITHNRQTIGASDVIYGVTMPTKGVSAVISMQFSDYKKNKNLQE